MEKTRSPLNYQGQAGNDAGARTCLHCRRLHSLASPCPQRTNRFVTALRQWESGYMLDNSLSPGLKIKAREMAAQCSWFLHDPA